MFKFNSHIDHRARTLLVIVSLAAVVALAVIMIAGSSVSYSIPDRVRTAIKDPGSDFTARTGMAWPSAVSVVSVGDDHGGFHGDGAFHVIFDTDQDTLVKWLAGAPPWGQSQWDRGPVPIEIGIKCAFGASQMSAVSVNGGPLEYSDSIDPGLKNTLSSKQIWYAANERNRRSVPWHNGSVLIVDLEKKRVWLSVWDY